MEAVNDTTKSLLREISDEDLTAEVKRRKRLAPSYWFAEVASSSCVDSGRVIEISRCADKLHISADNVMFYVEDAKVILSHIRQFIDDAEEWRANR